MLILTRKEKRGFKLIVAGIEVSVMFDGYTSAQGARICIDAPPSVEILRDEISYDASKSVKRQSVKKIAKETFNK